MNLSTPSAGVSRTPSAPGIYPVQPMNAKGLPTGPIFFAHWNGQNWGRREASMQDAKPYDPSTPGRRPINTRVVGERVDSTDLADRTLAIITADSGIAQAPLIMKLKDVHRDTPLNIAPGLVEVDKVVRRLASLGRISVVRRVADGRNVLRDHYHAVRNGSHVQAHESLSVLPETAYADELVEADDPVAESGQTAVSEDGAKALADMIFSSTSELHEVSLTPALAAELLARNTKNRPVRPHGLSSIISEMTEGRWRKNGDTIRFSKTNRMLDGQHRCMAVVATQVAIPAYIVTQLDDEVFDTIDRGTRRTNADMLGVKGENRPAELSAALGMLINYVHRGVPISHDHRPTPADEGAMLESQPSIRDAVAFVEGPQMPKTRKLFRSKAGLTVCYHVFSQAHPEVAQSFFASLESGANLPSGSPILALLSRLRDISDKQRGNAFTSLRMALLFKAFRLYRDGDTIKVLRLKEGESPTAESFVL